MKNKIVKLEKEGIFPTLGIIRLGNNPGDVSYEKSIIKACDAMGIKSNVYEEETSIDTEGLISLLDRLNNDKEISGILVFRPLPKHIDEEAIKNALENYKASNSRSQWLEKDGNYIILDAYNANPTSMKAAIENFAAMPVQNKVLVLGSMMELGTTADKEHQELIHLIENFKWEQVVLTGKGFDNLQHNYLHFSNAAAVAEWIKNKQLNNMHILIKGSRSMKMEEVLN